MESCLPGGRWLIPNDSLSDRTSTPSPDARGVPQGLVLGSLLFICYHSHSVTTATKQSSSSLAPNPPWASPGLSYSPWAPPYHSFHSANAGVFLNSTLSSETVQSCCWIPHSHLHLLSSWLLDGVPSQRPLLPVSLWTPHGSDRVRCNSAAVSLVS